MTTYARQKKKTTCSISNVTLTKTTSGEKPKNVAKSTPIKDKTSVNGKQLTVGNMAQSCVSSTQNDLNKHQLWRWQCELKTRTATTENNAKRATLTKRRDKREQCKEKEKQMKKCETDIEKSIKLENMVNEERSEKREIIMKFREKKNMLLAPRVVKTNT